MTTLLSLNGIARSPDGLHPLLVALFERQRSLAIEPKVVALAACRGDRMEQAGPFPGTGRCNLEAVVPARKRRPARRAVVYEVNTK